MAQALPSFVELLASLELESEENSEVQHYALYPTSPSFVSSSPSPSLPSLSSSQASPGKFLTSPGSATSSIFRSPSIVISHPSSVDDSTTSCRRSISNRYTPYVPSNAFTRRRSLPGDLTSRSDRVQQKVDFSRASSSSPPIRRASLGSLSPEYSIDLSTRSTTTYWADQPISALVRRRWHPHSSRVQSPEFRKATPRSISPTEALTPVTLPSLPPLPRIFTGTNIHALPLSESSDLPPISVLNGSQSTSNIQSRASRIPRPSSSCSSRDNWKS